MIIQILLMLLFGAIIGWLAGIIMKSRKSLLCNIILGIVGSVVGGLIASFVGIGGGLIIELVISVAGACLVIFIARALKIIS